METNPSNNKLNARCWLKENGYSDVALLIESYIEFIKKKGSGERRNYWDLLSGRQDGKCFERNGFTFPILESVRSARKPNYKPSNNAIKRNQIEIVPPIMEQARWKIKDVSV